MVDVEHNDQQMTVPLLIVRAEKYAPPLLGRAWMTKIRLDWKNLFSPSDGQFVVERDNDERIERLKERCAEIFKPELGTVNGATAKLHLKDNVKPVFQEARPVPYAYVLVNNNGDQHGKLGEIMSKLVFDAIGKYIHPTRYRQIVETQSLNQLTSESARELY